MFLGGTGGKAKEILSLLESLLKDKPKAENLPLKQLCEDLHGRPVSDIAFLVREAARRTVRAGKEVIGAEELLAAEKALPPKEGDKRRMGFR